MSSLGNNPTVDPNANSTGVKPGDLKYDPFYILATSPQPDQSTHVIKQGDTFAVFNLFGDIDSEGIGEKGIYQKGTRHLSSFILSLDRVHPLFLSANVKEDNDLLTIDLTNPDIHRQDNSIVSRSTLHIFRCKFLWQGSCYERITIRNYSRSSIQETLRIQYDADFADIFEVRGTKRKARGQFLDRKVTGDAVLLAYQGLDTVTRRTQLKFIPEPKSIDARQAIFEVNLPPDGEASILAIASFESGNNAPFPIPYEKAIGAEGRVYHRNERKVTEIWTSNEQFNRWLSRANADLHMMTTKIPTGIYPYAGVPWFSTPFGRDGIITALECLWFNPELSKGVLAYLASTQAKETRPEQDAEPGKILHEARDGEMANLGEIPFKQYYGSVDTTPLFVVLANEFFIRTGDLDFIKSIWPNLELALSWIDKYGDQNGDGFTDYNRKASKGLVHQGWKDSYDAIFHEDGELATGPIALCEVQGYVYAAKKSAANLASTLGKHDLAQQLLDQAKNLQERFEKAFWCEPISTYALALDGDQQPCRVRTSNAGHCLITGIAEPEHARRVAQYLLSDASFSGWGIRTVASSEVRYNPMSYHNGSVWPHDNALIAQGLAIYGHKGAAMKLLETFFDASVNVDFHRLPELLCGFQRRPGERPTRYPVACAPQSWSAASIFLFLQASLGLTINSAAGTVTFNHPVLPSFLKEVRIGNLKLKEGSVDLLLMNRIHDVGINCLKKTGNVQVLVVI
jgi:glycogen debranching enzyme